LRILQNNFLPYEKIAMKKISISLFILSIAILMAACNNPSADNNTNSAAKTDSTSFDMSKAKSVIADINEKFSEEIKKGDSVGMASHYASDAWVMPPNSEPVPKDKIVSAWGGAIRMGVKDLKIMTDDVTGNAEVLGETGRYEMYGDNNKLLDKGKYVVIWKAENGEWKLYRDIWNTSMPASSAK
jgi:ketosteroid isomerase-like protein